MSFIEKYDFIIYQHLNKRTKILPLATSQIAHATSLNMFALLISMPRFKSIIFYQNNPKIKLFLQKSAVFERWGLRSQTPKTAPHYEFLATRL